MIRKFSKTIVFLLIITTLIAFASGCSKVDVVGQSSITTFEAVLNSLPDQISYNEENKGWALAAPDNSVSFIWSDDYSQSPLYDVMLEFDATPFINAGLDPSQLPDNYILNGDKLIVGSKLGEDELTYSSESSPLLAFEQIVNNYRSLIGYHMAMDHFNVDLTDGNMFEWAKDMSENTVSNETQDKDIVFVLNPEPLIEAGVDPENVDGWVYSTVSVEINGKATDVYKFLKPFDLQ